MAATVKEARALGEKISSATQAQRLLQAGIDTLIQAAELTDGFSTFDVGVRRAFIGRISRMADRGSRITVTPSNWQADRVALFVLQTEDILRDVATAVRDSQARDNAEALLNEFLANVQEGLRGGAKAVADIVPKVIPPEFLVIGAIVVGVVLWLKIP